jgi:hypothetical protein
MAKPKASTKKKRGKWIRRRIAAWADATGDDDAFLDAMVEVTEEAEARIDYSLVIRERSRDGYTGNALTIPVSRADALVFAAAAAPFSTAEAEKRWASEKKRRREAAAT